MAKRRGPGGRGGAKRPGRPAGPPPRVKRVPPTVPVEPPPPAGPLVLGVIPGATPGKWVDRWQERMPHTPIVLEPIEVSGQREALTRLDAAFVRLPIARDGLHVIALYDERPVVVVGADDDLTAVDELRTADLAGHIVIRPLDDVLGIDVPGAVAPRFAPPETTADAISTVASGVGVTIVPMSLARLHQRRDVAIRPLVDGPVSAVALAWEADRTTPLVDAFVGVVRGRTTRSSRG